MNGKRPTLRHPFGPARAAYSLAELLVAMAIVATVVALVVDIGRGITRSLQFIQSVALSADGSRAIAAFNDGSVRVWDTATGKEVAGLGAPRDGYMSEIGIAISPDGRRVARVQAPATGIGDVDAEKVLPITDLETGQELVRFYTIRNQGSMKFSPDGKQFASGNPIVDALGVNNVDGSGGSVNIGPLSRPSTRLRNSNPIHFDFSADGKSLFAITSTDFTLTQWDVATGALIRRASRPIREAVLNLAASSDGQHLAVSGIDLQSGDGVVEVFRTSGRLESVARATAGRFAGPIAFLDGGQKLAIGLEGIEIREVATLTPLTSLPLDASAQAIAATPDGKLLAIADYSALYLYDGTQLRKLANFSGSGASRVFLLIALVVVMGCFGYLRRNRTARTCAGCGKPWHPAGRTDAKSTYCTSCRPQYSTTAQIRASLAKQRRQAVWSLAVLAFFLIFCLASTAGDALEFSGWLSFIAGWLFLTIFWVAVVIGVAWLFLLMRKRTLARLRDERVALESARKAAGQEGRIEEAGTVVVWTDAPAAAVDDHAAALRLPSAGEIAQHMDDCRQRIEAFIGEPCPAVPPLRLYVFSTTAAASSFCPMAGFDVSRPAMHLGYNAGAVSLEAVRQSLLPLLSLLRSTATWHVLPQRRGRSTFWPDLAVRTYAALVNQPGARDNWRRKVAVFVAEDSFLPLAELFRQKASLLYQLEPKRFLPEHYGRLVRAINQWLSLVDYLAGPEAPDSRREQLQRFWAAVGRNRSIDRACVEVWGDGGTQQLEREWKHWAAGAPFNPPLPPPPDVAQTVADEIVPIIRDGTAPLQRRIKAIRTLGYAGWAVGIDTLVETLSCSNRDLEHESLAALRRLSGRPGLGWPSNWQPWLDELHAARTLKKISDQDRPIFA